MIWIQDFPSQLGSQLPALSFQLARVWRYFIVNRSYQNKSPADALAFAFRPVFELFLMLVLWLLPSVL